MTEWAERLFDPDDAGQDGRRKKGRPWTIHRKIRTVVYVVALVLIAYGVIWYLMR